MKLFQINRQQLTPVNETQFNFEKDIQKLTEANLDTIFSLEFVASEFNLEGFSLDTLAFNPETWAFEIIEYKKRESFSIMDQGQTYLNLLFRHKADALLTYNETKDRNLRMKEINWDQTRVKFIAPNFTPYQVGAVSPKHPYELWEVRGYRELISYNRILSTTGQPTPALKGPARKEIRVYTRQEIVGRASPFQKEAVKAIEEKVFQLGNNVEEVPKKTAIVFKTRKSFLQLWLGPYSLSQKNSLTVYFTEGNKLIDRENLLKGSGKIGRHIKISSLEAISEIEDYLQQAYQNSL